MDDNGEVGVDETPAQKFGRAVDLAQGGDYAHALELFAALFEDSGITEGQRATCAYNTAVCWMKQGNNEGAMSWYGHYLGMGPSYSRSNRCEVLEAFFNAWRGAQSDLDFSREE